MKVALQYIQTIIDSFIHSFDGTKKGSSAKKLSAFAIMACIIGVHINFSKHYDEKFLIELLATDYLFVLSLFGIGTFEKVKNKDPEQTKSSE